MVPHATELGDLDCLFNRPSSIRRGRRPMPSQFLLRPYFTIKGERSFTPSLIPDATNGVKSRCWGGIETFLMSHAAFAPANSSFPNTHRSCCPKSSEATPTTTRHDATGFRGALMLQALVNWSLRAR